MEYVFKKSALQELLNNAADDDVVSIGITFTPSQTSGKFEAEVTAKVVSQMQERSKNTTMAKGCPSPPGCT
jgi:predicted GNAT family acetyltransferase